MSELLKSFHVRYVRLGDSKVQEAEIRSTDGEALRRQLHANGWTVLNVSPHGKLLEWKWPFSQTGNLSSNDYVVFCKEVRTLLRAGMTIVEAVDTLSAKARIESTKGQYVHRAAAEDGLAAKLSQRLQKGLALSVALAELPHTPPVLVAAVRAGERTSGLIDALEDYLRFDALISNLRKKIVSAAIYPALVTAVGVVISLFLLLVVMPNFASMYESVRNSSGGAMSSGAAITVNLTRFIGSNRGLVLSALALVAAISVFWVFSGLAKSQLMSLAENIPFVKLRIDDFQLAMMYQALALLIKGGYPMTEAVQIAYDSALSLHLKRALTRAREDIEKGLSVSQAFSNAGLCDEVDRRLISAAERNGEFYLAADVVSRMHGERFEIFVERLTRIVEPILLLLVALMVGGIVILMYMPVFDMATQLL